MIGLSNARRFSSGKSAALSAVHLLEWRNFRLPKNAAAAEIPIKAVCVQCRHICTDGERRSVARRRHGHGITRATARPQLGERLSTCPQILVIQKAFLQRFTSYELLSVVKLVVFLLFFC